MRTQRGAENARVLSVRVHYRPFMVVSAKTTVVREGHPRVNERERQSVVSVWRPPPPPEPYGAAVSSDVRRRSCVCESVRLCTTAYAKRVRVL